MTDRQTDRQEQKPDSVYLGRFNGPSGRVASLHNDGRKNLAAPASTNVLTIDSCLTAQTTSQSVILYLQQTFQQTTVSCSVISHRKRQKITTA